MDADFARLFGFEDPTDPVCVKSCNGYSISDTNCPVVWASKLQVEMATPTKESKWIALSHLMQDCLHVKKLVQELVKAVKLDDSKIKFVSKSTVYEDNNRVMTMARTKWMTPRTRHCAVKMFWFLT